MGDEKLESDVSEAHRKTEPRREEIYHSKTCDAYEIG